MEGLYFRLERFYTRGILLPPDTPVDEKGSIISNYELILFPDDQIGGVVVDGKLYHNTADYFVFCKKGQHRKCKLPARFYAIGFSTTDAQLKAALDALPVYGYHPNMEQLLTLYKKIYYIPSHTDLPDRLAVYTHLAAFLQQLLQAAQWTEIVIPPNSRRHREALLAANQYLKDHLEEDVDLAKLAESSHLHPTYFHKLFTEAFGKSPAQQLMHHRIAAARELLRRDDCTIAEIARKCGFSSQSYFCRKYKEISRETPSRFRKAIRRRRKKQTDP